MPDLVFNVAKGRVAELHDRVDAGDPSTSRLFVIPVDRGAVTDATLRDCADFAAVLAAGVTERTTGGWNRKTVTGADIGLSTVDNAADRRGADLPDQTWTTVTAGVVTDLIVCYSPVVSPTNAQLVPLVCLDFPVTPVGASETAQITDYFRAT